MALSRALTAQLKKYNTLLYPAKLAYRADRDKYFFVFRRDGHDIRKVLSDDIDIAYERACSMRDELTKLPTGGALGMTLEQWHERWSRAKYAKLSPKSVSNYRYCWEAVGEVLKSEEIAKVTKQMIEDDLESIKQKVIINEIKRTNGKELPENFGESKKKHVAIFLSVLLNAAAKDDVISKSPWSASYKSSKKMVPIFDVTELIRLCDNASESSRPAIALAAFCGLRRGEVFGLKIEDVDLKNRWLYIKRSKIKLDGVIEGFVKETKTGEPRVVPIPEIAIKYIKPAMEGRKKNDFLYSKIRLDLTQRLKVACKNAKLKRVTYHELRHICGSNIMMNGDLILAKEVLGHKNTRITEDVYGHIKSTHIQDQIDKMYQSDTELDTKELDEMLELANRILALEKQQKESKKGRETDEIHGLSLKLAKLTLIFCHQLTPSNKKGLTRKPVSP